MSSLSIPNAKVVHEAVDERQFIRVKFPARVSLQLESGSLTCEIADMSLGGLAIITRQALRIGTLVKLNIQIELTAVRLEIDALARVAGVRGDLTCVEFVEIDPSKCDVLRYLISCHLSGDIASVDGVLTIIQRENHIKQRKQIQTIKRSWSDRLRATAGTLLYLAAGIGVLLVILYKVYLFMFQVKAEVAFVDSNAYRISMPENGTVNFLLEKDVIQVKAQQPIATVSTQLSTNFQSAADLSALATVSQTDLQALMGRAFIETVISSPCDCHVYYPQAALDRYAYKYQELVHLLPVNEDLTVSATFGVERLKELNQIDTVRLQVLGNTEWIEGEVLKATVDIENQKVILSIKPLQTLPLSSYLQPVSVEIMEKIPFLSHMNTAGAIDGQALSAL